MFLEGVKFILYEFIPILLNIKIYRYIINNAKYILFVKLNVSCYFIHGHPILSESFFFGQESIIYLAIKST